jgi:hypothetical protein
MCIWPFDHKTSEYEYTQIQYRPIRTVTVFINVVFQLVWFRAARITMSIGRLFQKRPIRTKLDIYDLSNLKQTNNEIIYYYIYKGLIYI